MKGAGGVATVRGFAADQELINVVEEVSTELATAVGGKAKRKSPLAPLNALVSMEHVVVANGFPFFA